ncbi:hypothetical protein BLJ79_04285 [Arthrobacter sp. UCD-GKA]|uniref:hypothetical protein n=1 Tax=Arthrobacter sp. UCD-GKA TaxID=1913576 RepID=UPI0008DCD4AC|nr:hypothetical protein [Arthrobacter sp. UCD-GKA]OIH86020.1 hypothetical protein BLJ79_04285 [Arthrobacter sp. UCD-GKA]
MSKNQQDTSLGKGVIFFAVVTALAFVGGIAAPLWTTVGIVLAVITGLLALLWYINFANRKKV